jgi:hypothetical protein
MLVGRVERTLAIDGVYIHVSPFILHIFVVAQDFFSLIAIDNASEQS